MKERTGIGKYLATICHGHGGFAAARVFPKKLGWRVSERTASIARSASLKKKLLQSPQFALNMNNCHTKDSQHNNSPILFRAPKVSCTHSYLQHAHAAGQSAAMHVQPSSEDGYELCDSISSSLLTSPIIPRIDFAFSQSELSGKPLLKMHIVLSLNC